MDKKRINIAIVEDDEEIRADFSQRIGKNPSFSLLASYPDAESAIAKLPGLNPDVVLMDINLPGMDGVECVRQLKAKMPDVQFMMLTVYEDGDRLFKSLTSGASGYLLKRTPAAKLMAAIQEVYDGGAPMTPEVARRVVQYFQRMQDSSRNLTSLTARETDVLEQLSKGYLYKEIVNNLGISFGTLHSHISRIYEKLHVHSRTEAVLKYLNH
ncbi:MAG TPA: response regulator transcription factor [Verrucomicrobiae bacterium]|nr:response regulator transcription factor [Verrucomicrobiae bacterium]